MALLKEIWQRLTTSRVAWMALPAGIAVVVKAVLGADIEPVIEGIFGGLWLIISVFVATNNPTNKEGF